MKSLKSIISSFIKSDLVAGLPCGLLLLLVLCGTGHEALAASRHIQYLQIEANEGHSSGGHTALRFDEVTFHFQHETSGLIRIKRLDSKSFDHMYAVLGNRAIRESWITVSEETFDVLLDGFNQFLIVQDEQVRILDTLQNDVRLFEFLLEQVQERSSQAQPSSLPLRGVGYFLPDNPVHSGFVIAERAFTDNGISHSTKVLSDLKARVRSTYGENFIEQRLTQTGATLRGMKLAAAKPSLRGLSIDTYPAFTLSPSSAYDDVLLALAALQLLQVGPELMPGSYWSNAGPAFLLTPEERLFLRSFAVKLENDLVSLVNSSRSDWGFSFIVGMARLAAVEASLASGRMVFLDIFPGVDRLQSPQSSSLRRYLPAMRREAEEYFLLKRKEFFAGMEMREADFAALELLGNSLMELEHAIQFYVQPRRLPEMPIPSRQARSAALVRPDMSENDLTQELKSARLAEKEYAAAIANLYEYDLLRRNCVTEIFAFINMSLMRSSTANKQTGQFVVSSDAERVRNESLQRLGGYVDATKGLNFIPVLSAAEVDACYRVTATREQPSYRAAQLAEMKKHESALLVFLRESNTITSTIYNRPPNDSPFLFFTDDTVILRPVFGAFNLLVGVGESLLGLVTLPVEGTHRLYLGAQGILFSLPELVFISLRKGTMEYVAERR